MAITKKLEAAAKIPGGSTKALAKQSPELSYDASTTNWTDQPLADKELINFLAAPKAAEVYKAKGMQPCSLADPVALARSVLVK